MDKLLVYVGTYTSAGGQGIHALSFDPETGALAPRFLCDSPDPSFLLPDAGRRRLYAVNELMEYQGKPGGAVSAYAIAADGSLAFLNRRASHGAAPCHLALSRDGGLLFVSNYFGGNLAALPLSADGALEDAASIIQHRGPGPNPKSDGPHVHCVLPHPSLPLLYAVDLGLDAVKAYRIDDRGGLTPAQAADLALEPASGPRQLALHPGGRFAYLMHEHHPTLAALALRPDGALTLSQTVNTLPDGFAGTSYGAHAQTTPDGRFLYASQRGHDTLIGYSISLDGSLALVGRWPTGSFPRHFAIDPSGHFLISAAQKSHLLEIFHINPVTGGLTRLREHTVASPTCVQFLT